jgi:hypothetical protein
MYSRSMFPFVNKAAATAVVPATKSLEPVLAKTTPLTES